jgi:hypothetical protein
MTYSIIPATENDLDFIYDLFEKAIRFQQENGYKGWPGLDKKYIRNDVTHQLLFKVQEGNDIAGIFCVCYSDELIWREMEQQNALYLHRIVVNREVKTGHFFEKVMQWAMDEAVCRGLDYIRMDTWAENDKLISYYKSYGFRFVENYTTANTTELPEQHRNLHVALLEFALEKRFRVC